jgi:transcriptional regulator with XRE-family HTH domain
MLNLEQIRTALDDRNVEKVSARTGIHRNTIAAIRTGANANPTYATMKLLSDYLTAAAVDGLTHIS